MTPLNCPQCGTELPPGVLACPACSVLIHSERLKELASQADAAASAGDLSSARGYWVAVLDLLPLDSQQHAVVRERVAGLTRRIDDAAFQRSPSSDKTQPWLKRGAAGISTVLLLLAGKIKFLLLGLTKASTLLSMFAFFGVYWSIYGWPLAAGLVVSIYIHEMGHVSMLRRLGIHAGAPLFIPGVGALVMLKQHVADPHVDAKIGLAGPVWGLGAALAALMAYAVWRTPIWLAIAELTAFINLFNLIPIWQLDGSRGVHALASQQRWALVGIILLTLIITGQRMLWFIGGVAVWRAMQHEAGPGDTRVLLTFAGLVIMLSLIAGRVG